MMPPLVMPMQREMSPRDFEETENYANAGYTETTSRTYQITALHPRTYNEARNIGEHFRQNTPVIMNLSEMDDADAKRLVDFAAGLTFGLHGRIERVTAKVFLLSPHNVTVTAQDARRRSRTGSSTSPEQQASPGGRAVRPGPPPLGEAALREVSGWCRRDIAGMPWVLEGGDAFSASTRAWHFMDGSTQVTDGDAADEAGRGRYNEEKLPRGA